MNRTAAPRSARILAVCSIVLSGLAFVLYIAAVVLQRQYKALLAYPAELVNYFVVPLSPVLANLVLFITQLVFCILLISSGNKPVWTKGKGAAFVTAEAILLFLSGVLLTVLSKAESAMYAQYGAYMTASYSAASGLAAKTGDVMTGSVICSLIAFSIVVYRSALDRKAQISAGGFQ